MISRHQRFLTRFSRTDSLKMGRMSQFHASQSQGTDKRPLRPPDSSTVEAGASHRNFVHPKVARPVTLAGSDGSDAKEYQEKAVRAAIGEVQR